jgi:hypothetical protein
MVMVGEVIPVGRNGIGHFWCPVAELGIAAGSVRPVSSLPEVHQRPGLCYSEGSVLESNRKRPMIVRLEAHAITGETLDYHLY